MPKEPLSVGNESGSILVVTLMVLALMTIVAFSAVQSSTLEIGISGNHLLHHKYFFAAEAGIGHAVKTLSEEFITKNASRIEYGMAASWNFAFSGADRVAGTLDDAFDRDGDELGSYSEGAEWIGDTVLDEVTYRVVLWNNDDTDEGGSYQDDRDGKVWVRCDAAGPKGGRVSIQILLQGKDGGPAISDYSAQAGAGNNHISEDMFPVVDFMRQM